MIAILIQAPHPMPRLTSQKLCDNLGHHEVWILTHFHSPTLVSLIASNYEMRKSCKEKLECVFPAKSFAETVLLCGGPLMNDAIGIVYCSSNFHELIA
jgi:hypothetical protein